MDDGWETRYSTPAECAPMVGGFLDPLDGSDGTTDHDTDGLDSLQEYQLLAIEDGVVVAEATNPCDPDTDADGLLDGVEVAADYGGSGCVPTDSDTDDDGLLDGEEDETRTALGPRAGDQSADPGYGQ